ncbi:class E sortase [Streptomyces antibioticus]|uniref:class E sortase n=1 Tax=Streptomyces antibioticus TaxID=1890 RepID=UPI0022529328|nr:class E sortase [Streptomyces antibioticus]MCX4738939.1 class E sortase [Streptomyces antibioticus]
MRTPLVEHGTLRRRARIRRAVLGGAELLVTVGVVLLLLVAHQLWWTNREAKEGAERRVEALEREWRAPDTPDTGTGSSHDAGTHGTTPPNTSPAAENPKNPKNSGTPTPDTPYAILTIPRLTLRVPIAEGTGKRNVLDKGYAGHYLHTQQPGQEGNFALAGHRNTHGEPFRHLDRLRKGDLITVETRTARYTYTVDTVLPRTSPRDTGVIGPVPRSLTRPSYGYDAPGRYLTLTTCTPEYTSRYRLVVWGTLTSGGPRR